MTKKEPINILILGAGNGQRWLTEIARANRDCEEEITGTVMHPYECMLFIPEDAERGKIYQRGLFRSAIENDLNGEKNLVQKFDAVIPRIAGERVFEYGCNVIRQLALANVYSTAPAYALENCSNKWKTSQLLSLYGMPVPDQLLLESPEDYQEVLEMVGGVPAVGKITRGSQGAGVFKLNDYEAAITALQSMQKLKAEITLNRFVKTGKDCFTDVRVWVIGCWKAEPTLYAMQRTTTTDFRTNLSLDGIGTSIELTKREKEICIRSAQIMNMDICAVDLVRDIEKEDKPLILELNGCPGTKIEKVLGKNIVGAVVDHVIDVIRENRKSDSKSEKIRSGIAERFNESDQVRLVYHLEWKQKLNRVRKSLMLLEQRRNISQEFSRTFPVAKETQEDLEFVIAEIEALEWLSKGVH